MSDNEGLGGRTTRECVAILDTDTIGVRELDRENVLRLMAKAYLAGRSSGLEEWGASLDRMHGPLAEADTPAPLALQPPCACGHRYDHHDHRPNGSGCYRCDCAGLH